MINGIKKINKYLIYDIFGMVIYGLILYFGFIWLAKFALVYACLWNFCLIILALAFDGYTNRMMQSDDIIMMFKKKYDVKKAYHMIMGGFITFKTLLYLLYIFILIISQIIEFTPTLVSENLSNFIHANNYSILFLLAFDTLVAQFSKDKERIQKISTKFKEYMSENQD